MDLAVERPFGGLPTGHVHHAVGCHNFEIPGYVLSSCSAFFSASSALRSGHVCHLAPQRHSAVSRAL